MPRKPLTAAQRSNAVQAATDDLPGAVILARRYATQFGATDTRTLQAWENVEALAATAHRQSRLLAGKSKGG